MRTCQPRQDGADDCAEHHAAPGHDLDRPFDTTIADDPAADAAAETRQGAGHVGQPDRQAFDMLDGSVHHAHGKNDHVEPREQQVLHRHHRGERQNQPDAAKHHEDAALRDMGDDNTCRIAKHEDDDGADQDSRVIKIALAQGECGARRIACHEGNEIAGEQKTGRIGHAGQKRNRADEGEPGQGSAGTDDAAAS